MTFNQIVKRVCEAEGMKVECSVGNVREILRCLRYLYANNLEFSVALIDYLDGRAPRKKGEVWAWNAPAVKKNVKKRKGKKCSSAR